MNTQITDCELIFQIIHTKLYRMYKSYFCVIQLIQNSWWIIEALVFDNSQNITLCLLSILCILFRIMATIFQTQRLKKFWKLGFFSMLANNICYTEVNVVFQNYYSFLNHINTLIIILNYKEAQDKTQTKLQKLLSVYTFPLYVLVRLLSKIFIEFSMYLCEAATVYTLIFFLSILKQRKLIKKCQSIEESEQPKKKKSIIVKQNIKRDNQHTIYSQRQNQCGSPISANIQINIKDTLREGSEPIPSFHSKLKPGFKSQLSHLLVDRFDHQVSNFYQNIVNIMPQGVILINKLQQIQFMNSKCEKLLQCDGKERVLEYIKKCLSNCELSEESSTMKRSSFKGRMPQRLLEDIIRYYKQNQQDLDVFDVLLNPNKYIAVMQQAQFYSSDLDGKSSVGSAYVSQSSQYQENSYCFETILENEDEEQEKRLKFILVLTQMTPLQLDGISQSMVSYTKERKQNGSEVPQPLLLILIKNTTHKIKVQELKKERLINNTLLKSFSHELRTPLNSSLHMLNITADICKDGQAQTYLNIAKSSIKLLIYQINDILDFAAIQSQSFSYHATRFQIQDIIAEISELYFEQAKHKLIDFQIECEESLQNTFFTNDRQRIMQILVNLLNNSFKYTKQNGQVRLAICQKKNLSIKISVKDNGIGILPSKLDVIRKQFCKPSSKLSQDNESQINGLGLGLKISGTICQGLNLMESSLDVKSFDQNGTKVSFCISNQDQNIQEGLLSPVPSNVTGRFELLSPLHSQIQCNSALSSLYQLKQSQKQLENPPNESSLMMKENIDSPRLNDQQQASLVIPTSHYNFKSWITHVKNESSTVSFQVNPRQCSENCTQILIVDDIPFNQIAFSLLLEHLKIKAESAYDGFQAVEMVKKKATKHCKYYKIIFMDIEMPGQNGFQTSKIITQFVNFQSVIVMCSAYDTIENYHLAQNCGITEFLPKPVNKKELERILRKYQFKV